jgi:homoserine/homoserine lactone efflux protein
MSLEQLWLFTSITLIVSASPGPVMLACMIDAGRYGFTKSLYTMAGATLGNLVLVVLSALGLGFVAEQAEWIFHGIKWIGAAYLVYLGIELMRAAPLDTSLAAHTIRSQQLFSRAFIVAVTNPKGLIYFGALFPQFIDINHSLPPQFALLTTIFVLMDFIWMSIYALGGRSIMHWLGTPKHQRWFNWISGGLLIVAGIALAFSKL